MAEQVGAGRALPFVLAVAGCCWLLAAAVTLGGPLNPVGLFACVWAALMSFLAAAAVRASLRWSDYVRGNHGRTPYDDGSH